MRKNKLILNIAAFALTTTTTLSFIIHSKFSVGARVYGQTANGGCTLSTCRTTPAGKGNVLCHTVFNFVSVVSTNGFGELWKSRNPFTGLCTKPTLQWTAGAH